MPMIKCPECGRDISSYAPACPGCGVPQEIIKKLLAEQEKPNTPSEQEKLKVQPEPTNAPAQEVKAAPQLAQHVTPQSETILKKHQTRKIRTARCVICKKTYMSDGTAACPECKYPTLSLIGDKQRTKEEIKIYRKAAGIQDLDLKAGQFYKMGRYGGEEINWRVLAVEDGKALLISEKGLDAKRYNEKKESVTWETCTLRKWLNNEFYNSAFGTDERGKIRTTKVTADKNPKYNTDPGKDTEDKIFLLSIQEAQKYFTSDEERKAYPAEYAKANRAYVASRTKCCWWWLRSPGYVSYIAAGVNLVGGVNHAGDDVDGDDVCVRPALWVNL